MKRTFNCLPVGTVVQHRVCGYANNNFLFDFELSFSESQLGLSISTKYLCGTAASLHTDGDELRRFQRKGAGVSGRPRQPPRIARTSRRRATILSAAECVSSSTSQLRLPIVVTRPYHRTLSHPPSSR